MSTPTPTDPSPVDDRLAALDAVMLADAERLRRRIEGLDRQRDPERRASDEAAIERAVATSAGRVERRLAAVPRISYPANLPVSQRRDDIAEAIAAHQVVIVAGETGSGKTTQIPKICLELGRGVRGTIGHTQPRRLAARTVAERIAEELDVALGGSIGYAVRFTDKVSEQTLVKVMTDGILLTDLRRDRDLLAYDTLIIDEAHERSLNIDFILGYLKQLLPRRPDLKVIVTSATIDPQRFSHHFDDAPIIEVSGRTFPVEVRYRPLDLGELARTGESDLDADLDQVDESTHDAVAVATTPARGSAVERDAPVRDQIEAISDAVLELQRDTTGDILVFLSGEREIRDTADALNGLDLHDTEILPLYARLSSAEQHRVFANHRGRRVVLATNVAETSLTVPGIRSVIDTGTARISRYSHRLKVQRLPIEAVSQASANQRAGRCGRVAPGVCIRLYSEDDHLARPEFTEPEILRTNLASVVLQMTSLGLGDLAAFPFVEPPDRRAVTDAVRLLQELGALELDDDLPGGSPRRLTAIGRQMARLPVDPRFARMVIEATANDCLREVLIIAAGLSIEDPRERPREKAQAADEHHARFVDPSSDFLSYLELWRYVREQQRALSSGQFRRLCKREFLNYLRLREWQDVHSQLRRAAGELDLRQGTGQAHADAVHRSLLAGLLSHIGYRDRETRDFRGARGARFAVFPGSALAKKPPQWVMAAELVETSRLWARTAARIEPDWAEHLAPHLVTRAFTEPTWSARRGQAMVNESVSLYGLPIVTRRPIGYAQIDRAHARELFIRHALVQAEWRAHHRFIDHNREVLEAAEALEQRFRVAGPVDGDDLLHRLYDERIPARVTSARHFDTWWKKNRRTNPDLLTFTEDQFLADDTLDLDEQDFPDQWVQGNHRLDLSYSFEQGSEDDGVVVHVPLAVLNQIEADGFEWQVPGLREELVSTLIRSLPKVLRRNLVPIPDTTSTVLDRIEPLREPLVDALARELARLADEPIGRDLLALDQLPDHLRVTFHVEEGGYIVADGKDLDLLKRAMAPQLRTAIAAATAGFEQPGLVDWSIGELPRTIRVERDGRTIVGYPALVDEGETVAVRLFDTADEQDEAMWAGTRRLLQLTAPQGNRAVRRRLLDDAKLALASSPYPTVADLADDCTLAALEAIMVDAGAPAWDAVAFDAIRAQVANDLSTRSLANAAAVVTILTAAASIDRRLAEPAPPALGPALDDMTGQRIALLPVGFVAAAGTDRLPDIARYLRAIERRLDDLRQGSPRDRERMAQVQDLEHRYGALIESAPAGGSSDAALERIGWMIEELRVSLFAQSLGTPEPISATRITKAMAALA